MFSSAQWDGIEGIVIDAVGTLIEPVPTVADVYLAAALRQGVTLKRADVKARFSRAFRAVEASDAAGPLATDEGNEHRRWRRIVNEVLAEVPDPETAFDELWAHFARPDAWCCFADVVPTLDALDASGIPVRIGSNFDGRLRPVVAGLAELERRLAGIVISSEVGFRKPDPRFFEAVRESLGVATPAAILCVGDDLENDVLGARRAGLRAILLDRVGGSGDAGAIRSLAELIPPGRLGNSPGLADK